MQPRARSRDCTLPEIWIFRLRSIDSDRAKQSEHKLVALELLQLRTPAAIGICPQFPAKLYPYPSANFDRLQAQLQQFYDLSLGRRKKEEGRRKKEEKFLNIWRALPTKLAQCSESTTHKIDQLFSTKNTNDLANFLKFLHDFTAAQ